MHKGRRYPYDPQFWVTATNFWPAYMPWKMSLFGFGPLNFPFPIWGDAPLPLISNPCEVLSRSERLYTWPVDWTILSDRLTLNVVDFIRDGSVFATWHVRSWLGSVALDGGEFEVASPVYNDYVLGFAYLVNPPAPPTYNGDYEFEGAAYYQGGSPWA